MAVLSAMLAVLGWSLVVRWPHMPVDPRSIAGAAYYVAESREIMLGGVHTAEDGRRYFYGRVVGEGGRPRMIVDIAS